MADVFLFSSVVGRFGHLSLPERMLMTLFLVAPLGFFMGMPFPKAGLRVGELIDWGFAVNGAAAVLGSTLVVLVAFSYGFRISLLLAAALYVAAMALLRRRSAWVRAAVQALGSTGQGVDSRPDHA